MQLNVYHENEVYELSSNFIPPIGGYIALTLKSGVSTNVEVKSVVYVFKKSEMVPRSSNPLGLDYINQGLNYININTMP